MVLLVLLLVACFLAWLHRRKRSNKTVIPAGPKEESGSEEGRASSPDPCPGRSEENDPEVAGARRPAGRARSAAAVLLSSAFSASGKDGLVLQNQLEARNQAEGEQIVLSELLSNSEKNEKPDGGGDLCVSAPYLSIGTNPDPGKASAHRAKGQRSPMGRISTWPPTAAQWQARWDLQQETVNRAERSPGSDSAHEGDRSDRNQHTAGNSEGSEAPPPTDTSPEEQQRSLPAAGRRTLRQNPNPDAKPAREPAGPKAEQRDEPAAASRQRGSGPKAPSGGASPDTGTLLSLDLLHEVVQNNGRWTRERWRQIHVNRQRR